MTDQFSFFSAGVGVLTHSPIEEWDAAVDINIKAAMRLTKFTLPHLTESASADKVPTILNVASVSGKNAYASLAPCTFMFSALRSVLPHISNP